MFSDRSEQALTVRNLMQPDPVLVDPDRPIRDVLGLMNAQRIGGVVVVDAERRPVGIFTERDLLRQVADAEPGWHDYPVSRWMTAHPHTATPDMGFEEVIRLMDRLRVRHLPVVEDGRVVGILSSRMLRSRHSEYLDRQVWERTRQLKQLNDELMARDSDLRYHLKAAGQLQNRLLLPHAPPNWPELRWGLHYMPFDHLGGDYYDIAQPDSDHLGFLIADASGHSIAAGMVAIMSRLAFTEAAATTTSPGVVLTEMNHRLQGLTDERFVTAFYAVLNRRTRVLTYSNAGHPYPLLWVAATQQVQPLSAQGFMLGIMPEEQYRDKSVQLSPGDRLCFYTDGLIEARNEIGETYGTDRLMDCLKQHGNNPAPDLAEHILHSQQVFRGTYPLTDDLTLVVAELCQTRP